MAFRRHFGCIYSRSDSELKWDSGSGGFGGAGKAPLVRLVLALVLHEFCFCRLGKRTVTTRYPYWSRFDHALLLM